MPRRRKWQPIPIFLLGKPYGQRSLAAYRPEGHKELNMAEHMHALLLERTMAGFSVGDELVAKRWGTSEQRLVRRVRLFIFANWCLFVRFL